MSQPNPQAEYDQAFEELKEKYPDLSDEELVELLDEINSKYN